MKSASMIPIVSAFEYTYILSSVYCWYCMNRPLAWTLQALVDFRYTYIIGTVYDW